MGSGQYDKEINGFSVRIALDDYGNLKGKGILQGLPLCGQAG